MIQTLQLSKSFPASPRSVEVLSNINLQIEDGEFIAIMGNSGSGKSTLLNLIGGLDIPSSGTINIDEKIISHSSEKKLINFRRFGIGIVFQDYQLISHLSLWENVLIAGFLDAKLRKSAITRADALFERFGLSHAKYRLPAQVSGGEQQRAAIIRALINRPKILLADEPTGNLNSFASLEILQCLDKLNQEGQTIFMVTHDINSASFAQRIIFLKDGFIKDQLDLGSTHELSDKKVLIQRWLSKKPW